MLSAQEIEAITSLQQIINDSEDSSQVIPSLLKQLYIALNSIEQPIVFISAIVCDSAGQVSSQFTVDQHIQDPKLLASLQVINLTALSQLPICQNRLGNNQPTVIDQLSGLIAGNYPDTNLVKQILTYPIYLTGQLAGIVMIAVKNDLKDAPINNDFIVIAMNILVLAFRLQQSQQSLTNITQQVYNMNAQLHQLDKLKDDFVSVASHELRTPMTAIRSYSWMALYKSDIPLSAKQVKYLQRILSSTERLINLVNDMLNVSRIESGRVEILPKPFSIEQLIGEVFSEIEAKAAEKKLQIILTGAPAPIAFADPDKVHQILLNLLGNALKFTPENGKITVNLLSDGQKIEVAVTDNGVGISADDAAKLFKKFSRLDSSYVSASTSGGTGLGLYICKSLIELMKGTIRVQSAGVGQGSSFIFTLPLATDEVVQNADQYTNKVAEGAKQLETVAI